MVVIVVSFPVSVEQLADHRLLPSVAELRPACCPVCDQPAMPPGERLGIVGHGTYQRQVLGLAERFQALVVWVRRYLCRGCGVTISVLHEALYPGRWYAGGAILASLFLHLVQRRSATRVRERVRGTSESAGWRTLRRWQRQLLCSLWGLLAKQLGFPSTAPVDRDESRLRLQRLLALRGAAPPDDVTGVESVAPLLVRNTTHDRASALSMRRSR
jgi:hypothetical protein